MRPLFSAVMALSFHAPRSPSSFMMDSPVPLRVSSCFTVSLRLATRNDKEPNNQCALYSPVPVPLKNFLPRSACQSVKSPSSLSRSMCILSMFSRAERLSK